MIKLKEIYQNSMIEHLRTLSVSNIDDIFEHIKELGIREVSMDEGEMHLIVSYMTHIAGNNEFAWKALSEGKVDKFMGVRLHLCTQ